MSELLYSWCCVLCWYCWWIVYVGAVFVRFFPENFPTVISLEGEDHTLLINLLSAPALSVYMYGMCCCLSMIVYVHCCLVVV